MLNSSILPSNIRQASLKTLEKKNTLKYKSIAILILLCNILKIFICSKRVTPKRSLLLLWGGRVELSS